MLKQIKRNKILDAAIEMLAQEGTINSIKVSDIAKKADIGKGSIYIYFASKEDVIINAIIRFLHLWTDPIINYLMDYNKSFKEIFYEFMTIQLETSKRYEKIFNRGINDNVRGVLNDSNLPKVLETMKSLKNEYINKAKEILLQGVNEGVIMEFNDFTLHCVCHILQMSLRYFTIDFIDDDIFYDKDDLFDKTYNFVCKICS